MQIESHLIFHVRIISRLVVLSENCNFKINVANTNLLLNFLQNTFMACDNLQQLVKLFCIHMHTFLAHKFYNTDRCNCVATSQSLFVLSRPRVPHKGTCSICIYISDPIFINYKLLFVKNEQCSKMSIMSDDRISMRLYCLPRQKIALYMLYLLSRDLITNISRLAVLDFRL